MEEIILTPIKSDATRVAAPALRRRGLHQPRASAGPGPPRQRPPESSLSPCPARGIITFQLNGERNPALKNPKVRLAMAYAYDKQTAWSRRS